MSLISIEKTLENLVASDPSLNHEHPQSLRCEAFLVTMRIHDINPYCLGSVCCGFSELVKC